MNKVLWDKAATMQFKKAIAYIRQESPANAEKVKLEILQKISLLSSTPEINPPDKFKISNKGNYRAFELHRYRVSYMVKPDQIIITRIRHTSMKPRAY